MSEIKEDVTVNETEETGEAGEISESTEDVNVNETEETGGEVETSEPKIVWGTVCRDGKIHSGSGFMVTHDKEGIYSIMFKNDPFANPPAVVVTQLFCGNSKPDSWDEFTFSGGDPRDNAVLIALDESRFKVKTGCGGDGDTASRNFSFVAIGT